MLRIIGIDPGSVCTGYGIIDSDGRRSLHVAHGHIRVQGDSLAARLGCIYQQVSALLEQWQPGEMAIEDVFVNRNALAALKLGQARGAAVVAASCRELAVSQYTPRAVKQAVVGYGGADKNQVQHMIGVLLKLRGALQADAADALAVALCHAHTQLGGSARRTVQQLAQR